MPLFYGWLLVAIGFLTMAVGVNARTAFSLLFPPILDDFGWDRGTTAGIFSFGFLASALVTPCVGRLMDRRGPSLVVELGIVAMAAGLLLAPLARHAGLVTVLDGAPSTLSWLGGVRGMRVSPLGTERFGQTGDLPDLYRAYRLDADAIVDAAAELFIGN